MPFDKATTKKLEDAFSKHGPESGLHHVYVSATHVVDLKEMTQKNVQTGYSRRILREVVKLPGAEAEFMALVSQFSRDVAPLAKQLVGTLVTLLGILLKLGMRLVDVGRQLFNERTADMREAAAEKKLAAKMAALRVLVFDEERHLLVPRERRPQSLRLPRAVVAGDDGVAVRFALPEGALDAADADAELVPLPRRVAAGLRGGPGRRQRRVRAPQGGDAHAAVVLALGPRAVELREREPRLRSRECFCRASRTRREQTIRPKISLGDDVPSRSNSLEHRRGTPRRASAPSARSAANASAKPSRSDDSTSLSRSSRQTGAAPSSTRTVRISSQTGSHLPRATGSDFFTSHSREKTLPSLDAGSHVL